MPKRTLYGGIEAGGTKIICGIGSGAGELISRIELPTTNPDDTISRIVTYFQTARLPIKKIGIGMFGPIDLDYRSPRFGTILNTPKINWRNINIAALLHSELSVPLVMHTDTDIAAFGEYYHGKALGMDNFLYLTIGTGIGGTLLHKGSVIRGVSHSELGHISIPTVTALKSACHYHAACLEGYASGSAVEKIYGIKAHKLVDPTIWEDIAEQIAYGLLNILSLYIPEKIIIGGGVVKCPGLLRIIHHKLILLNNGYLPLPNKLNYIQHASSDSIGVLGAIKIASVA